MTEPDAGVVMFLSTLNEGSFRGENPARLNDEPYDFVKTFFDDAAFAVQTGGVDPAALERASARNDERFESFLTKSRAKIAGTEKDRPPSPYLYAKRTSGAPLAKGEVASRMFSLLEKLRGDCIGDEEAHLEGATRSLDVALFAQIAEGVVSRLKRKAA